MVRALHICAPDQQLPNSYADFSVGHIIVMSSRNNIKLMNFTQFLREMVLPGHTYDVQVERMPTKDLNSFEAAEYELLYKTATAAGATGISSPDEIHAFRTCWYAATKEVI